MKCLYEGCVNSGKEKFCSNKCRYKYNVSERRNGMFLRMLRYKGNSCEQCGLEGLENAYGLLFIGPEEKKFELNRRNYTRSWTSIAPELDKYLLLCPMCAGKTDKVKELSIYSCDNSQTFRGAHEKVYSTYRKRP
jgi:hypothetical protein